jgi:hypothetical protein
MKKPGAKEILCVACNTLSIRPEDYDPKLHNITNPSQKPPVAEEKPVDNTPKTTSAASISVASSSQSVQQKDSPNSRAQEKAPSNANSGDYASVYELRKKSILASLEHLYLSLESASGHVLHLSPQGSDAVTTLHFIKECASAIKDVESLLD